MRLFAGAAALAVFSLLNAVPASGQTADVPDLKGRTIRAVAGNEFAPFSFVDPRTGKPAGLEYDVANDVARRLNARVAWSSASWDTLTESIRDGRFDVGMDAITITEGRKRELAFSNPYYTSRQAMLVRAEEARFTGPTDFAAAQELLVGAAAGSSSFFAAVYDLLDGNEKNPRVRAYGTPGAAVRALLSGDVDCVIMDDTAGKAFVVAGPGGLKLLPGAVATEDYGFVFRTGSDLVAPFNAALSAMRKDGTLDRLTSRWFADTVTAR